MIFFSDVLNIQRGAVENHLAVFFGNRFIILAGRRLSCWLLQTFPWVCSLPILVTWPGFSGSFTWESLLFSWGCPRWPRNVYGTGGDRQSSLNLFTTRTIPSTITNRKWWLTEAYNTSTVFDFILSQ